MATVKRIQTHHFRNLEQPDLAPHPRFNVLFGDNAQGKTNLLDAVHLVLSLGSIRGAKGVEMVRFGQDRARVSAVVDDALAGQRQLSVTVGPGSRTARVDDKVCRNSTEYRRGLCAVVFVPEDLQIPRGSPGSRRQMLDRAVAAVWPTFAALARDYRRVVQSRNKLLREHGDRNPAYLEVYDRQLAQFGARLVASRRRYLARMAPLFSKGYRAITRSGVSAELCYRTTDSVAEAGQRIADLETALTAQLAKGRPEDLARRSTIRGPHADDVDFVLDRRSCRLYGSQGQVRSAVLALKLAEISNSYDILGFHPTLLLDDVSSELDARRNEYLFDFIGQTDCQTFLTTTEPSLIRIAENRQDFHVVNGTITPHDPA